MLDIQAPVKHRSVSQLSTYANCSERYRLERVVRAPQRQAAWTIQGLAVHEGVEAYERSRRALSVRQTQEAYRERWDTEIAKARHVEPDIARWMRGGRKAAERDINDRYQLGLDQVESYILDMQANPRMTIMDMPDGTPAIEVPFRFTIGGVDVVGYIDQIVEDRETGTLMVRDLKTGNEPAWPIQLVVYRLAMKDALDLDIRWGDFYLSKKGGPTAPIDLMKYDHSQVSYWFANLDAGIREEVFLPNPGSCFACPVRPHCPAYVS
ncbi:PD-(D/E)XK nuclease family protein [Nocardiopsis sp. NPDC049922]|uniref:RecB family exonuclease n=1 Tax=Nocardiopsis sp. NPDC049922 TaxID=3155157 RepID=UPI0033C3401F